MSAKSYAHDNIGVVKVLFFGATADLAGAREITVADAHGITSRQLFVDVLNRYPKLALRQLRFSVNQNYASGNEILRAGDEVAIFTTVSGG